MKIKTVRSSWFEGYGYRLDCQPYLGGALETKTILERLPVPKQALRTLTAGHDGGIYNGPQFSRTYVSGPDYGVPFVSSSSMLYADLSSLPYLSKALAYSKKLRHLELTSGITLISCSGTIGKTVYVRPEMNGIWSSQHIMKVVPNHERISSGYLYAYLSSKFGIPLLVSGTYGSIIKSLEPEHLFDLPVPRLNNQIELCIHQLIEQAAIKRTEANVAKRLAISRFEQQCGLPAPKSHSEYGQPMVGAVNASRLAERMDAFYHSPANIDAQLAFSEIGTQVGSRQLGEVAKVYIPGIFKRQYANDPQFGYPYLTGADVFCITPVSNKYLLKSVAEENRLILTNGMILIHEAGQLYGLIGRSVMVGEYLDGFACTNNMVRVVTYDRNDWGFVFALLSSEFGMRLVKREGAGSSIPHLEEGRIQQLQIPWPLEPVRSAISEIMVKNIDLLDEANRLEAQAQEMLVTEIDRLS